MKRKLKASENQDWREQEEFTVVPSVRKQISEMADDLVKGWYSGVLCDLEEQHIISPPEQFFYVYWQYMNYDKEIELRPQHQVGSYYVDFSLCPLTWFINECEPTPSVEILKKISTEFPKLAIEIDGHWHEKTSEQVEKDKQRERFLIAQGYTVLRFSAREIFSDVQRCVEELYQLVQKSYSEIRRKHRNQQYES